MALFLRIRRDGSTAVSQDRQGKTGPPGVHHFDPRFIHRHVADGIISLSQQKIVIHSQPGKTSKKDVAYRIVRTPGAYCTGCGDRIGDGPARTPAAAAERDAKVCDGGTAEVIHFYDTELEE